MSSRTVSFYARAAVLDHYVHLKDLRSNTEAVQLIITMLRSSRDLRDYFFRSGPSAAWAPVLWDEGFFGRPPEPKKGALVLPRWDVQEYLITVAGEVPDVVLKHIESIDSNGLYHARALRALCALPAERIGKAISTVMDWLNEPTKALAIAREAFDLFVIFVDGQQETEAFQVFASLTEPLWPSVVPSSGAGRQIRLFRAPTVPSIPRSEEESLEIPVRENAISKFEWLGEYEEERMLQQGVALLLSQDAARTILLLEQNLCRALAIEAEELDDPRREFSAWWRVAVEETGQDVLKDYKDRLFVTLRDAVTGWAQLEPEAVRPLIQRYLRDDRQILRRLGLYLLFSFPEQYSELVTQELCKPENLHDIEIHHEYLVLLRRGYKVLPPNEQAKLVDMILEGPLSEETDESRADLENRGIQDAGEILDAQRRYWIFVRLSTIEDHLKGEAAAIVAQFSRQYERLEHASFTRWHSGPYWVRDVSPAAVQDLRGMTPEELRRYVESFEPPLDSRFGPERISHRGLAEQVAKVIIENSAHYCDQLVPIARHRPEYAVALLEGLQKIDPAPPELWEISLQLCEGLLEDHKVRADMGLKPHGNWQWARSRVVDLVQSGFNQENRRMPLGLLPRARDLLVLLLNDPSPDSESDRPLEGYAGHMDPVMVAINTIRPKALIALLDYARYRANQLGKDGQVDPQTRLELEVREALDRKLDRKEDPSWAVHSVYGLYLRLLSWLDTAWFESNLDRVLPEEEDEATRWYFAAAWDAYVTYNPFSPDLFDLLRKKYRCAVDCLRQGIVTQGINEPQKHLAMHLIVEYLLGDYEPAFEDDRPVLLAEFFSCPVDVRSHGTWSLWRFLEDHEDESQRFWPRAWALWAWRVREASRAGHPTDFDDEMEWLAKLPMLAPESKTMTSLWPMLEGMLPHVSRPKDHNMAWEDIELYLAREVERDPVSAIRYYSLMHQQGRRPTWQRRGTEARKIIETAAANEEARKDALELIDLLARRGVYEYRDIYERYAG